MAPVYHLRTATSILATFYIVYVLITSVGVRQAVLDNFSYRHHPFRLIALLSALLLNAKSIPLAWHVRLFTTMLYHLYIQPHPLPKDALFRPIVTTRMYTSFPECDYNGHKSNSTYFADLDISRTAILCTLLRTGFREAASRGKSKKYPNDSGVTLADTSAANDAVPPKGAYMVALGSVSCNFKREIKPYERFEIWTRVLSWDRKWIYLVSHVVRAGEVLPEEWALQPLMGKRAQQGDAGSSTRSNEKEEERRARWQKAIFATSIAKYVIKKGRVTVPPETAFTLSALLPLKPGEDGYAQQAVNDTWNWEMVEGERLRGFKLVEGFSAMDGLLEEFPASAVTMRVTSAVHKEGANGHVDVDGASIASTPHGDEGKVTVKVLGEFRDWVPSL